LQLTFVLLKLIILYFIIKNYVSSLPQSNTCQIYPPLPPYYFAFLPVGVAGSWHVLPWDSKKFLFH